MSLAFTPKIELGYKAPYFELVEPLTGLTRTLNDFKKGKALVVMFICNHCPYVIHVNSELIKLANKYIPLGINFVAINPNDANSYPDDSPENMAKLAKKLNYPFPYLYDETQEIAKKYNAACTPDFSIFDEDLLCIYRGQLDDSRPNSSTPLSGTDIRSALDKIIRNESINTIQTPSSGCSIKWK